MLSPNADEEDFSGALKLLQGWTLVFCREIMMNRSCQQFTCFANQTFPSFHNAVWAITELKARIKYFQSQARHISSQGETPEPVQTSQHNHPIITSAFYPVTSSDNLPPGRFALQFQKIEAGEPTTARETSSPTRQLQGYCINLLWWLLASRSRSLGRHQTVF